ncbi:MAG: ABC transporter ATP-binding protein [Nakamurella sp.]
MIEVRHVSKRYGDVLAVDSLDFTVRPGIVTGFLGPNGAGKSTTMRIIMGLDRPTTGEALVNGKPMTAQRAPLHEVGALLEAKGVHPGRSARNHLLAMAATTGIGAKRVDEVLEIVGLAQVANKRAGTFSLGMGQRLGIAVALLGDPEVVILDEPVNGLDPEGVRWIRYLLRDLAAEGRTVFVSSHLMNEMAVTAEHLIIVGRGKLIADESLAAFTARATHSSVMVRAASPEALRSLLASGAVTAVLDTDGALEVTGMSAHDIGEKAFAAGIAVHELTDHRASLEDAFMEITGDSVEYHGGVTAERYAHMNGVAA